jgi:hypothetical protein
MVKLYLCKEPQMNFKELTTILRNVLKRKNNDFEFEKTPLMDFEHLKLMLKLPADELESNWHRHANSNSLPGDRYKIAQMFHLMHL